MLPPFFSLKFQFILRYDPGMGNFECDTLVVDASDITTSDSVARLEDIPFANAIFD
jgi:hypothetical protein